MSPREQVRVLIGDGEATIVRGDVRITAHILNPEPIGPGDTIVLDRVVHEPGYQSEEFEFEGCYVTELVPKSGMRD